jgi:hypothetical protein
MRWLMIALLASVSALLITVLGVACHIRSQHARLRREPTSRIDAPGTDPEQ